MKAKFKKDLAYPWIWGPVAVFGVLIIVFIVFGGARVWDLLTFVGLAFVLVSNYFPYRLTDNNTLEGNGVISVNYISKLEKKNWGVKIYYTWAVNGVERTRFFAVKDKEAFISALLEINSDIKLA